ncbi:MAG TPA: LexA family transcriptional regulator [Candidatus Avacidaminococcus intestinavium]|uniref:LexA family transcriptional regulator n=1 Tax=Candidatus Avacidaminococcus intestinavium TaxID=2840684 RepID=A0A9D1SLB7_9FIRM|nr:LexA family transcriptional regulator [Candidatus Avacidaminococcus intestinavium]
MITIGHSLKQAREQADLKQTDVFKLCGISNKTLSNWENNVSKPDPESLIVLASIYKISLDHLLGYTPPKKQASKNIQIPIFEQTNIKLPDYHTITNENYAEISNSLAQTGTFFAVKIKTNDMEPRIYENDIVIVRKQTSVKSGDIALISLSNNLVLTRQVFLYEAGLFLLPFNYRVASPQFYNNQEINYANLNIIGKIVELRAIL